MSALVCCDCGKTLITDSVQSINQILKLIETLEERISALEEHRESAIEQAHASASTQATPNRDTHRGIAA
jgi:hypothetical protein